MNTLKSSHTIINLNLWNDMILSEEFCLTLVTIDGQRFSGETPCSMLHHFNVGSLGVEAAYRLLHGQNGGLEIPAEGTSPDLQGQRKISECGTGGGKNLIFVCLLHLYLHPFPPCSKAH